MVDDFNIWAVFPSADPERARNAIERWYNLGYHVLAQTDKDFGIRESAYIMVREYNGYWESINFIIAGILHERSALRADFVVAIGDDMEPDPNFTAQEIAMQMYEHFGDDPGVMQPCGDPQGKDATGQPAAARICGSPWFNRAWIDRAYGGNGPCPPYYRQFYGDEEIKYVSEMLGCLWMRPDLTQYHLHWSWGHSQRTEYQTENQKYWKQDQETFMGRKEKGFPGHELLPRG